MTFDASMRRLITAAEDGSIHMWNFNNGQKLRAWTNHQIAPPPPTIPSASPPRSAATTARAATGGRGGDGGGGDALSPNEQRRAATTQRAAASGGDNDGVDGGGAPINALSTEVTSVLYISEFSRGDGAVSTCGVVTAGWDRTIKLFAEVTTKRGLRDDVAHLSTSGAASVHSDEDSLSVGRDRAFCRRGRGGE